MKPEKWKDIKGYEGYYQISNWGRIKSLGRWRNHCHGTRYWVRERIKKQWNRNGYQQITLAIDRNREMFYIQVLVATYFRKNPNPEIFKEVNHLDGNKLNNYYKNLEWTSHDRNIKHAHDMGLFGGKFKKVKHAAV